MKKRVLSMLLAFILCFSTLPMTAFAQEADAVAEQEEQQETDSAAEQEEAEAAAAPGEETPADKSTTAATPGTEDSTAGEAPILWNPQWQVSAIVMPARRIPRQTMRRRQQCRRYRHSSMLCRTK